MCVFFFRNTTNAAKTFCGMTILYGNIICILQKKTKYVHKHHIFFFETAPLIENRVSDHLSPTTIFSSRRKNTKKQKKQKKQKTTEKSYLWMM